MVISVDKIIVKDRIRKDFGDIAELAADIKENGLIIKIAEHERNHRPLAYIEQIDGIGFNKCYLIEVKGLVKV